MRFIEELNEGCGKVEYRNHINLPWDFGILLYTHIINIHIYTYTCRIHFYVIIKTSEDFFKKIYLSFYLKVLCVRGS